MGKKVLQTCILGMTIGRNNNNTQGIETELQELLIASPQDSEVWSSFVDFVVAITCYIMLLCLYINHLQPNTTHELANLQAFCWTLQLD